LLRSFSKFSLLISRSSEFLGVLIVAFVIVLYVAVIVAVIFNDAEYNFSFDSSVKSFKEE
jgi:hypothetical protein